MEDIGWKAEAGVKPRSPKGRAAARGLDAVSGLPTHFHASGRHFTQIRKIRSTQSKISLDSDHGIYRDWTGARAPGVEQRRLLAWRCSTEQVISDTERRIHAAAESTKGGGKPNSRNGNAGSKLNRSGIREGSI